MTVLAFEWKENFQPQVTTKGQKSMSNPKMFKPNISKTVRDKEKSSIEVR